MGTQSSPAVALRALVILTCLVAIPLIAVFGRQSPEALKTLLAGKWPLSATGSGTAASEPPRFEPLTGAAPVAANPAPSPPANWQADPAQPAVPLATGPSTPPVSAVVPAGYSLPPQAPPGPSPDQSARIQERLKQLGATYYVLEPWGNQEGLYRFYCRVAVGGDPNFTQYFEATDSDGLRAMGQVLQQVESWRAR